MSKWQQRVFLMSVGLMGMNLLNMDPAKSQSSDSDRSRTSDYYSSGMEHYMHKRYQEAITDFSKSLNLSSQGALPHHFRGEANAKLKRFDSAVADYSAAIDLHELRRRTHGPVRDPLDIAGYLVMSYRGRAQANFELKNYQAAIDDYTHCIDLRQTAEFYSSRSKLYNQLGKSKLAEADLEKARELAQGEKIDTETDKETKGDKMKDKKSPDIPGWYPSENCKDEFEAGIDETEKHSGTQCAYLKSRVAKPKAFGNLTQSFGPESYKGKRMKMSAWVKTDITSGTAQLWLRIDGDWKSAALNPGCFDNMDDRPIRGRTDWTHYDLVVDLPESSTLIVFGLFLNGTGKIWLDDVSFEEVSKSVALTGKYAKNSAKPSGPRNLNFEDGSD